MAKFHGQEKVVQSYDPEVYPFHRHLAVAAFEQYMPLDISTGNTTDGMLENLHMRYPYVEDSRTTPRTRETDQQDIALQNLYLLAYHPLRPFFLQTYINFIEEVVQPQFDEPLVYQKKPTLRTHKPGDVAVGEYHTDAKYGHPPEAVNFWVPATDAYDTNTLHIQSSTDTEPRPVPVQLGEYLIFDGVGLNHGNETNTTPHTRVSFDFRVIPESQFKPSDTTSINTGLRFDVGDGGYYDVATPERIDARREEMHAQAQRTYQWLESLEDKSPSKLNTVQKLRQFVARQSFLNR